MSVLRSILVGGGVYLLNKLSNDSSDKGNKYSNKELEKKLQDLQEDYDRLKAQHTVDEYNLEQWKQGQFGELKDRLQCFLTVHLSNLNNREWNSGYELHIKNVGSVAIKIDAIRIFWTVEGRRCKFSPWSNTPLTIKPGQDIVVRLKGLCTRYHFTTWSDIDAVRQAIANNEAQNVIRVTKKEPTQYLECSCDAEFIISEGGKQFTQELNFIPGEIIPDYDLVIYYPYTQTNGTDLKEFDEARKQQDDSAQ